MMKSLMKNSLNRDLNESKQVFARAVEAGSIAGDDAMKTEDLSELIAASERKAQEAAK